jgi:light-regulated signal transduction histidine kinase (bacteriophytochrome)
MKESRTGRARATPWAVSIGLVALSFAAGWIFGAMTVHDRADAEDGAPVLTLLSVAAAIGAAGCVLLVLFVMLRERRRETASPPEAQPPSSDSGDARIRALESALAQRTAQLEAATTELETFAYSVSHDLRAPLRHISGYVQLLVDATAGKLDHEPRRHLEVISQASRHMGELIGGALSFSRIARLEMHETRVAPRAAVDAAIAGMRALTHGRNIDWRIADMPHVHADAAMLKIVYDNLIGNAIKFSVAKDPAVIEIGAAAEESGRIVLYVRDNGAGFDMTYAERLFGMFQRLHRPQDFEGTGTGLATVQRIIARHGGRVWAHAAPDEGATFCFTLARSADAPASPTQ